MIEIDGSMHSGSGTLLRYAVALATLRRQPLHISRIRSKRPKPGLRPQHLSVARACAELSGGTLEGAEAGSQEMLFRPGPSLKGGNFQFDIGTAGSATMAALSLIPPALSAEGPCRFTIIGGLFQDFAPSFFHLERVLVPILRTMAVNVRLSMIRPGYVPKGQGKLVVEVVPSRSLKPLRLIRQGRIRAIRGIAIASHLDERRVSARMAERCEQDLSRQGYDSGIDIQDDTTAVQRGAALAIWAETDTGCFLGADQAGKPGRRAEAIADHVAKSLVEDLTSGACTDRHLADQLVLFSALARGVSEYIVPRVTDHLESNLWLVEKVLGIRTGLAGRHVTIEGVGL